MLVEQSEGINSFAEIVLYAKQLLVWDPFVENELQDLVELMANQVALKASDLKEEFEALLSTLVCSKEEVLRSFGLRICRKCMKLKLSVEEKDVILGCLLNLQGEDGFC